MNIFVIFTKFAVREILFAGHRFYKGCMANLLSTIIFEMSAKCRNIFNGLGMGNVVKA